MTRVATIEEAAVLKWVRGADANLGHAGRLTDDAVIRDSVKDARAALKPALARAQLLLDHAEARGRESQHSLFPEEGPT